MKTLKNHLILFDEECPMCRAASRGIISSGMLNHEGRMAYQEVSEQACPMLDRQRAANEIALVDQETGEVSYGVESLFKLLAVSFPRLKPLFLFRPFIWFMSILYTFIASNRRVIFPSPKSTNAHKLQPTFRLGYRIAYLLITTILTGLILSAFVPAYLVIGGLLAVQVFMVILLHKDKRWDYPGIMMTICFTGALLLLPFLLLMKWFDLQDFIRLAGLAQIALVVGSLAIPRILHWKTELSHVQPLIRQMFWTYAAYILVINLCFGLISIFAAKELTNGSFLAAAICGFIALYWISRLGVQFFYFDRKSMPAGRWNRIGEVVLVLLFLFLSIVYSAALYLNYSHW